MGSGEKYEYILCSELSLPQLCFGGRVGPAVPESVNGSVSVLGSVNGSVAVAGSVNGSVAVAGSLNGSA